MVFYIIAAAEKDSNTDLQNPTAVKYKPEQAVVAKIKTLRAFTENRVGSTEMHSLNVDKAQFKIGSLDGLMALNESSAKLDMQLDITCKKFEKVCFDSGATELQYTDEMSGNKKDYKDYIKKFEWNDRKYNYKKPLLELCGVITKTMRTSEDMLKKHQEEQNQIKAKLSTYMKKEGGNLNTRDFTDDIYTNKGLSIKNFVEGVGTELFTNLLVVLPKLKFDLFYSEQDKVMKEYYDAMDQNEIKRIKEYAKIKLTELKEKHGPELAQFLETYGLPEIQANQEWEEKAHKAAETLLTREMQERQRHRMPYVIVPGYPLALGIEDKEGNAVYRLVVYKDQAEDVIKAFRKKGYTSTTFSYNIEAWQRENQERTTLKESLVNKTTILRQTAVSNFQVLFEALMHLKVIRAYIDGVLRFGIPPKFYIGVVMPKRGTEKSILTEMTKLLAEQNMQEMYGEKIDANEADDYWPFVCIHLTSPNFMHAQKE